MTLWKKCELRTYSRVLALLLSMILLLSTGVFQPTASAEESQEVWNPDSYEIHLMLDSDLVLDENHLLKQEYLDLFEVDDSYKTFSLAYYETQERDFFQEGWINRLRLKYEEDAEKNFKLSFKEKSYPEAAENRQMVMDALLERGILLKVDSLKTQQMLDAYLVSP